MSIGKRPCKCGGPLHRGSHQCIRCKLGLDAPKEVTPVQQVSWDRERARLVLQNVGLKRKYEEALSTIEAQSEELAAMGVLGETVSSFDIDPLYGSDTSEAVAIAVASDWHMEESVGAEVGGLNEYNVEIAQLRATRFFQYLMRLVKMLKQDVSIDNLVLALLGDFITNELHEESADTNKLQPTHAIVMVQNILISGIEFLLREFPGHITIPCHSGNHARVTKKIHFSAENGHSLEYLMYRHLESYFRGEPRVKFVIPAGYHSYLNVYDKVVRFHHGHAVRFRNGRSGIFAPVYMAIDDWNKARHADLDVFGHHHQYRNGGSFISNGSLIGYNGYALANKFSFEEPKQALFLIDKKRGLTINCPILVGI